MSTVGRVLPGCLVGTTSYLVGEGSSLQESYEANLRLLSSHVDMVQLLLLGKEYVDVWGEWQFVQRLSMIQSEGGFRFVVHLPLDLHFWPVWEEWDKERLLWLVGCLERLSPLAYVLHLDRGDGVKAQPYTPSEKDREGFCRMLDMFSDFGGVPLLFENTGYDLTFFSEEIGSSPFGVCFDVGHWWLLGREIVEFLKLFEKKIHLLHVHGVLGENDHQPLAVLSEERLQEIVSLMKQFPTVVEVFSLQDFVSSVVCLASIWNECGYTGEEI